MKKMIYTAALLAALVSCDNAATTSGKKFNPEKTSTTTMSDSERQAAIEAKKKTLAEGDIDSQFLFNGIKFSVLAPAVTEDVTPAISEKIAMKIMNIAAKNGVGGICTNPILGIVVRVDKTESAMTSTASDKVIVKFNVTIYCGNFITDDIYASSSVTLTGVGSNERLATSQAFDELKSTPALQTMFSKASERAMEWYNNESNVKNAINNAIAKHDYALAMAILSSVPAQSSTFEYATEQNAIISDLMFKSKSAELLAKMKDAITAANGEYSPSVAAFYSLIPQTSEVYEEATGLFAKYAETVEATRKDKLDRERALEDRAAADSMRLELERLEIAKIKAPYEAQATLAQINSQSELAIAQLDAETRVKVAEAEATGKANANTGGFLGLGKLWDGGFNLINSLIGMATNAN